MTQIFDDNAKRARRLILGLAFAIALSAPGALCEGKPAVSVSERPAASPAERTEPIGKWAECGGTVDSAQGVANAFAEAGNGAFTLLVDCPVFIHIGNVATRPIFVDSGTKVVFTGKGRFIVDNAGIPAFVIANSSNITFKNWDVLYTGELPLTSTQVYSARFNDTKLKYWLRSRRRVTYQRWNPFWAGPTPLTAIFLIKGSTANLIVDGMRLHVPGDAPASKFIPQAFAFVPGEKDGAVVTADPPMTAEIMAVPRQIRFTNIDIDGAYMGWQGNLQDATFSHIRSHRYSDLQDASGGNIGGEKHYFSPPHLFYLNYEPGKDPALFNKNITLTDVIDYGIRAGAGPRDTGSSPTLGNALSLKIGGNNVLVNGYQSYRPDGFLDLLASNGITIRNVKAAYDSAWLHYLYPAIRFPGPFGANAPAYSNVTLENVEITDLAPSTHMLPAGPSLLEANSGFRFENMKFVLNRWSGPSLETLAQSSGNYSGSGHRIAFDYTIASPDNHGETAILSRRDGSVSAHLIASPLALPAGQSVTLSWAFDRAASCAASGRWNAEGLASGTKTVTSAAPGTIAYGFSCTGPSGIPQDAVVSVTYTEAPPLHSD